MGMMMVVVISVAAMISRCIVYFFFSSFLLCFAQGTLHMQLKLLALLVSNRSS